ncbi:hypothetical protein DFAR_70006 [Desulfarculales bacterium]
MDSLDRPALAQVILPSFPLSLAAWSLSNLVAAMLHLNLFTYRELRAWLNTPITLLILILF